jgi:hypothetical protein
MSVQTITDLVEAVVQKQSTIEITGDLSKGIIKIKATGDVAWVIAIGALAATAALIIGSGGSAAVIAATTAGAAIAVLGYRAAMMAIEMIVATAYCAVALHLVMSQGDLVVEVAKLATGQSVLLKPLNSLRDDYTIDTIKSVMGKITLRRK